MKINRTKNARNSIVVGLILRIYQTVVPFVMRTVMIYCMGVEYLGLKSLFSSILHILNLAELGVGSAMVFSMYKPIAQDDTDKICALMKLYRMYYRIIGVVILVVGLLCTPFIPRLISGSVPAELNIYWLYLLNLAATVLTYWLFAYRNCLLQAHQRMDVVSGITLVSNTLQFLLQFVILIWMRDYYLYVMALLLGTVVNNVLTALITVKMYPQYRPYGTLEHAEVKIIGGKIRDLFSSKIGTVVLHHADTVVISSFLGLSVLAVYHNYYFIMNAVVAVIEMMISSIMAGLGNSLITESKKKNEDDLMKISFLYLWLGGVCCCCFLGMYQPFMEIWVGRELMMGFGVVVCYVLYFYVCILNRLFGIFKNAAGLWHEDRFIPLISAGINLLLNLLTVRFLGIYGVLLSTVLSLGFVSIPCAMRIVFTRVFDRAVFGRFIRQFLAFMAITTVAGIVVSVICLAIELGAWVKLYFCMVFCIVVPNAMFFAFMHRSEQFAPSIRLLDRFTKGKLGLEKKLIRSL